MKKIILSFVLLCGFATTLSAQDGKHEFTLGVGVGSTSEIMDVMDDILIAGLSGGTTSSNKSYTGAYHLGYKYRVAERLSLGATLIYENGKSDAYVSSNPIGKFDNQYYTLAAEGEFRYVNKGAFRLYGLLGAGATRYEQKYTPTGGKSTKDNKMHFNFQVTPIGVKFGNKIGGFVEGGFGYKGIISAGLFTRF